MSKPDEKEKNASDQTNTAIKDGDEASPQKAVPSAHTGSAEGRGRHAPRRERSRDREAVPEHEKHPPELDGILRERDDFKDKYLRCLAEIENQRKRSERDKSDFFQFALAETFLELLEVLDGLERALRTESPPEESGFLEGVRMIHKRFLDILARKGVIPISNTVGHHFDPNIHQALTTEESAEVEDPRVVEELQKGYRLHDRLLRPALVRVAVPPKPSEP